MSVPSPRPAPAPSTERTFTILVPVAGATSAAIDTITSVLEHAAHPERLEVAGTPAELSQVWEHTPGPQIGSMETHELLRLEDILRCFLSREPFRDVLFLRPGILVPPLFDLRLHWSAYSDDSLGAVFPLCDIEPLTSLSRHGVREQSFLDLDRFVADADLPAAVDAPFILPECFYLRRDQISFVPSESDAADVTKLTEALHRRGVLTALAPHVLVGSDHLDLRSEPIVETALTRVFIAESPLHRVARAYFGREKKGLQTPPVEDRSRPRVLLVMHSLGGGLDYWGELYASAARNQQTWVLKSIGERGRFGSQLWLYDSLRSNQPVRIWKLASPIGETATRHLGYRTALKEIVEGLGIEGVIVSSLIGHSLDVLRSGVKTLYLCHDYYPFCPALHIHYETVCRTCEPQRLRECLLKNPLFEVFESRDDVGWLTLRQEFLQTLEEEGVELVAPSESVRRHYRELAPALKGLPFRVIPHGDSLDAEKAVPAPENLGNRRLRIIVPGRLTYAKGAELFLDIVKELQPYAEFVLLGAGASWKRLGLPGVSVIPDYDRDRLPQILAELRPDLALLLSIVPETFSFTLGECFELALPVVATRVGSFEDRITHAETGFLCEPDSFSIIAQIRALHRDPSPLPRVRAKLLRRCGRSSAEMVHDYEELIGLFPWSQKAYFTRHPLLLRSAEEHTLGFRLPPNSPLGLLSFLEQVEEGIEHHLKLTPRLRPWQKALASKASRAGFWLTRRLANLF